MSCKARGRVVASVNIASRLWTSRWVGAAETQRGCRVLISNMGVTGSAAVCSNTRGRRSFPSASPMARVRLGFGLSRSFARDHTKDIDIELSDKLDAADGSLIRNFAVIAHVDHGKSTLSDRLLSITGTLKEGAEKAQYLDKLKVERDRGITVKAQSATMFYEHEGKRYILNLIDTPGHVDFSYEVSRSLAACEGVLLLVDAAQGIQAQTMANYLLALKGGLTIIPVVNKIDLPSADLPRVAEQIEAAFSIDRSEIVAVSGKSGKNCEAVLKAVIERIPPPKADRSAPLQCLLFDTWFDTFRGVVLLVRVLSGTLQHGDKIQMKSTGKWYEVQLQGVMHPEPIFSRALHAGQVGFIMANMKNPIEGRVGDTVVANEETEALPGFVAPMPMVFSGIYPLDSSEYETLDKAMDKLTLNDASVSLQRETSNALGMGFRCGFLGLLHMDVFRQRLENEHEADVIVTSPTVPYKARMLADGNDMTVSNPSLFPAPNLVEYYEEPIIKASVITPLEYMGPIMELCKSRRGEQQGLDYLDANQVLITYILPLGEIVLDFYDGLKGVSKGYASLDYEPAGYRKASVVKINFQLNGSPVDALATIVHTDHQEAVGRRICERLKSVLGRQQFEVAIQATVGSRVIARESMTALRKNVLIKGGKTVGGGDVTRKKKLLEKQKEGKKKMKRVGNVELSQDAFLSIIDGK